MRELLEVTDSRELAEWLAYERLEPWGEWRADLRMAKICCAVIGVWCKEGQGPKLKDFMPTFDQEDVEQSVADMMRIARNVTATLSAEPGQRPQELHRPKVKTL